MKSQVTGFSGYNWPRRCVALLEMGFISGCGGDREGLGAGVGGVLEVLWVTRHTQETMACLQMGQL